MGQWLIVVVGLGKWSITKAVLFEVVVFHSSHPIFAIPRLVKVRTY
jgi:hypothetical protein